MATDCFYHVPCSSINQVVSKLNDLFDYYVGKTYQVEDDCEASASYRHLLKLEVGFDVAKILQERNPYKSSQDKLRSGYPFGTYGLQGMVVFYNANVPNVSAELSLWYLKRGCKEWRTYMLCRINVEMLLLQ